VVLSNGQALTPELLAPQLRGERRVRLPKARGADLPGLIQQLVRAGIQTVPADDGVLHQRLVGGVERELIEQVMQLCDNVQVKAAARLGINRNTLHKKISEYAQGENGSP
jgi:DNA-binding NtrC family response regulator